MEGVVGDNGLSIFWRGVWISLSLAILISVYLFQDYPLGYHIGEFLDILISEDVQFIINKTARVFINDNAAILLIYALFLNKSLIRIAFWIQLLELFLILPIYFIFKLSIEGPTELSSPLLSQIHRLIINPTLMILLIFGYLYQLYKSK